MAPRRNQGAEWLPETCSKADLAVLLGISTRAISDWDTRGVLIRAAGGRYQTLASLNNYIAHLRDKKAGKSADKTSTGRTLSDEKAETASIDRQIKEIKLAMLRGDVLTLDEVSESWGKFATAVKGAMLSLPTRARKTIPHLTPHDGETLKRICRDILTDLSRRTTEMVLGGDAETLQDDK